MEMFYDLMIIGRLFLSTQSGMCFYYGQPLPVSRINWQILLSEQSKKPTEAAQFKACSKELGWHSCAALLSQSRWGGGSHACVHVIVNVCFHKARGSGNRLHGATHIGPLLPTKASSGTAELPIASIFLIADEVGEVQSPSLFFPQSKLSLPVQWSKYKPPQRKQQCNYLPL